MHTHRSRFLLAAAMLSAMAATAAAAQTTSFASSYNGAGTAGGSCSMSYSIAGAEPSGTGPYPVFIYMVGTNETYNNAAAMAAVNDMASKGYIAATVDYAESQFGTCSVLFGLKMQLDLALSTELARESRLQQGHRRGRLQPGLDPRAAGQELRRARAGRVRHRHEQCVFGV
jgi:hypothetical protein